MTTGERDEAVGRARLPTRRTPSLVIGGTALFGCAVVGWATDAEALTAVHPAHAVVLSVAGAAGLVGLAFGLRPRTAAPANGPRNRGAQVAAAVGCVTAVAAAGVLTFLLPTPPAAAARAALATGPADDVLIERTSSAITLRPAGAAPSTGMIFFPGMPVDARSYASLLRPLAADGRLVVMVQNPLQVALLGGGAVEDAIAAHPEVRRWAVAGHSLGGLEAAVAGPAAGDPVKAVILWAPACPLAGRGPGRLPVTVVMGSRDGVLPPGSVRACAAARWPGTARIVEIDGANHGQFGDYGPQFGDLSATTDTAVVQADVLGVTREAMDASLGRADCGTRG